MKIFQPEDFLQIIEANRTQDKKCEELANFVLKEWADIQAVMCNIKVERWLSEQVIVFGTPDNLYWGLERHEDDCRKARLVCVEHIK